MLRLKYGNTNTYFLQGTCGSILIDTDYAGTMPAFYKELKKNNIIRVKDWYDVENVLKEIDTEY